MAKRESVTSVEVSPEDDRRARFISYTIAMVIRVICVLLAMVVQGWLMWVFFAGAILLPYFAVVGANVVGSSKSKSKAAPVVKETLRIESKDFIVHDRK